VPDSTQPHKEQMPTSAPESEAGVLIVRRHHLVLCSHWLNVPIFLGLILSGMSIYWASPVYSCSKSLIAREWRWQFTSRRTILRTSSGQTS
jgi:hypothetical protein